MINFGLVPVGAVLPIIFDSFAGATGASVTISGLAVTDIEVYKGASVTQRSSDAGYALIDTDGIDIDSITGIHGFSIDTGDNTDASFYSVGSFFTVVVSAITVDSQTVNFVAATFRLGTAEGVTGQPKVDVAAFGGSAGTFSSGRPEVNTTHAAGTAWGSGAITSGSIAAAAMNGKGDWNIGKTGYSLTQTFPSNFSSLAITAGGAVTVGTNGDKTGYSLAAAYDPAKTAAQAGDAMTLSAAYDAAKTAATQASVDAVDAVADAIKAKTDSLTFTNPGVVNANVTHVISDPVQENGAADTEWGGAP